MRGLGASQFVGGLLHLLSGLGEFWVAAVARQFFELASHLLRFVDHFLLLALRAAASAALLLHLRAHSLFELLLLASRKLRKPPRDLVLLLTLILLLLPLNRFVLVLHLIELKLEEIGEFLLVLLAAALSLAPALRNLNFAKNRFGTQELLQGSLLGRHRLLCLFSAQLINSRNHLLPGLRQVLDQFRELRLRVELISQSPANSLGERFRVGLEFFLAQRHRPEVLFLLRRCVAR